MSGQAGAARPYFQAIPLYFSSDENISAYFSQHRSEIDVISGTDLVIPLAREVRAGDPAGIAAAFTDGQKRYPLLQSGDLPCFWLEDGKGGSEILRLPHARDDTIGFVRCMADAAKAATDARGFKLYVDRHRKADAAIRDPAVQATNDLRGAISMATWEKATAAACGVVFVAAILVMAIVFPSPTPFQYQVFRIVLSIAAAGFVSMTPGLLSIELPLGIKAGGALAVFVIVYFFNPASLITPSPDVMAKPAQSSTAAPHAN